MRTPQIIGILRAFLIALLITGASAAAARTFRSSPEPVSAVIAALPETVDLH